MEYLEYSYLWPPRPEKAIPLELVGFYEKRGWSSQIKMNGTGNVLAISPERKIVAMNRHNATHKLWTPTAANEADFAKLPGNGWYVFVAELLHSKVPGIRDVNYVHDVLVADGHYLVGESFADRQLRLSSLLLQGKKGKSRELLTHWEISPTLWLAKTFVGGHRALYEKLDRPEHEGIVLKNPKAPLVMCLKQTDNASWQVKIRKQHKNFSF